MPFDLDLTKLASLTPFSSILIIVAALQYFVIKKVHDRKVRTTLLYISIGLQVLAVVADIIIGLKKNHVF